MSVGLELEWWTGWGIGDRDVVSGVRNPVSFVGERVREGFVKVVGLVATHPIFNSLYSIRLGGVIRVRVVRGGRGRGGWSEWGLA